MGFCGLRTKNRPRSLRERVEVRQQRHDYLYALRKNRQLPTAQRYQVVYVDESFLHHHHGGQYAWFSDHDYVERLSGKGRRGCFMHAMQENALVDEALLAFEAQKSQGDYHGQFDLGCLKAASRAQFWCPGFGPHYPRTPQYLGQLIGFSA